MSEDEVSYYEIALTSRQVLVSFIVGLSCVALAFFAGVWVGQQESDGDTTQVAEAEVVAGEEPGEVPELDFFDDSSQPDAKGSTNAEPKSIPSDRARTGTTTGTVPPSGSIVLQVLSTPNQKTVEDFLGRLTDAGYTAYIQSFDNGGQLFFRLRLGPFADRAAAESAKKRVDASFNVQALITTAE